MGIRAFMPGAGHFIVLRRVSARRRRHMNRRRNPWPPLGRTDLILSGVSHCFWNKICCVLDAGTRVSATSSHWRGEAMTMLSGSDTIGERRPCAMTHSAKPVASVQLTDEEWFRRSGRVAMSIGHDGFHRELVDLFGVAIPHESSWIIRYSRVAPPDVLYTHNVPDEIVQFYNRECLHIDPFSQYWKTWEKPGILTLSGLENTSLESIIYSKIFRAAANVSDELGMFFTTVGHCCLGLFLEREKGHFSRADVRRAELMFPALDGYHRAHLGWLFNGLRYKNDVEMNGFIKRPTLIQDRFGVEVYANESWNEAIASDTSIAPAVRDAQPSETVQTVLLKDFILKLEVLDRYFPLAPAGRMFVLEPRTSSKDEPDHINRVAAGLQNFTRREREVLALIMIGQSTGQIAQKLHISKGTIKNCRSRIYRKADVMSERALVKKFIPIFQMAG
jgi:DNA-binding CsgD family transcriptional regulator